MANEGKPSRSTQTDLQDAVTSSGAFELSLPTSHDQASHDDDVWLEAASHLTDSGQYVDAQAALRAAMTSDVHRLRTTHTTAGYREGFAVSREAAVQPGFDEGHLLGAALGIRAGYLQGILDGLEKGIAAAAMAVDARDTVILRINQAKNALQLQTLLSQRWIHVDGTWNWRVNSQDDEEPTIGMIANAHPVILRATRLQLRFKVFEVYSYISPEPASPRSAPHTSPARYDVHDAYDPLTPPTLQRQQQQQQQQSSQREGEDQRPAQQLEGDQLASSAHVHSPISSDSVHSLRRTPRFDEGHSRPRVASVGFQNLPNEQEAFAARPSRIRQQPIFPGQVEADTSTTVSAARFDREHIPSASQVNRISKRTATAILYALEEAIRTPYPFTADLAEENASMAELPATSRTQNGGARPVPVFARDQIGRTVTPPTVIMKLRQEREEKRAQDEARRREQEGIEAERKRRSDEQRAAAAAVASAAAAAAAATAAGAVESGRLPQEGGDYRRPAGGWRAPEEYDAHQDESYTTGYVRAPQRRSDSQDQGPSQPYAQTPSQIPEPEAPVRRRPVPESGLPQPIQSSTSRARNNTRSNPQPRPVQQSGSRMATSAAPPGNPQTRTSGTTHATNQAQVAPSSTAYSRGQAGTQPTPTQPRNGTSSFPHAFERWEQLSAHWEGLTSYWIRRLEGNSEEISNQPINQQLARQVTDLSAAGANLFHAVVELQRLRASSERKFQRWFFETRSEQERTHERLAQLEADLQSEREGRAQDVSKNAQVEADRAQVELAREYRRLADDQMREMKRELQISRDEARRGWEEIGRMEQAERDRTYSLRRGQPTLVGGVQVVPMLQGGVSRHTSSSRERVGGPSEGELGHSPYDVAQSDTDTDPYIDKGRDAHVPPVPQVPSSQAYHAPSGPASGGHPGRTATTQASPSHRPAGASTSGPATTQYERAYAQTVPQPFYQQTGSGTALHEEGLPRADIDQHAYVHSDASEEEYELDDQGRVRLDAQGNPLPARGQPYRRQPEEYSRPRYTSSSAPPAPIAPTTAAYSGVSNGQGAYPPVADYSGAGYGWEGIPRHQHPTRLSDVLEEEDERSRTSPSRASERSRGVH